MQQDERVVHQRQLFVWIVDEVRAHVAAVKLHAFNDVELVFEGLAVFNRDHAFFADFFHCVSNDLADGFVAVSGDRTNLSDFFARGRGFRCFFQLGDEGSHCLVDAALEIHRVDARCNVFEAFANDGLCEHSRRRGAVTGVVRGLRCHFFHELSAHVLQFVFEFDFFSDRYAVFGDGRCAE